MDEVHQLLCPHVPIDKIVVRAAVLKEQLSRVLPNVCVEKEILSVMMCAICNNSDNQTMITNDSQDLLICLGADGSGCGGIVTERLPMYANQCGKNFIDPYKQFSS